MNSSFEPGIMMALCGVFLLIFHRKLAHRYAVYYQTSPETKAKMLEWSSPLGGALTVIMGIALFADPDHCLASILLLVGGLIAIFLSDWNARLSIVWYQSEKYQRIMTFLVGVTFFIVGLVKLFTRR